MRFDRVVNSGAPANQRFREFWADISGSGVDLEGPGRVVSLELETFSPAANLSQVLATKVENAKTPRAETLGVLCKLREPFGS